jgi:hypothetical protein
MRTYIVSVLLIFGATTGACGSRTPTERGGDGGQACPTPSSGWQLCGGQWRGVDGGSIPSCPTDAPMGASCADDHEANCLLCNEGSGQVFVCAARWIGEADMQPCAE